MIEQHDDETFSAYIRRLGQAVTDGDASWGTLTAALDECADEIEQLEAQLERVRQELTAKNYVMAGAGR